MDANFNFIDFDSLPTAGSDAVTPVVRDTFTSPVAFKFAFVGVGQAGGRIAATFNKMGYGRVCAINTALADLHELQFPEHAKLDIGKQQGAGKDPTIAASAAEESGEAIFDLYTRCWGTDVDYAFVCLSAAGGTGAGAYAKAAAVAKSYMHHNKRPVRVGCIMALPKDSDGQRSMLNTVFAMRKLAASALSPIIFIDNERFKTLQGDKVTAATEKPMSNLATAQLLHMFNVMAGTESEHVGGTTFDATDLSQILNSGVVTFASTTIRKWDNPTDITTPVRERLQAATLATIQIEHGSKAGLLYLISKPAWDGENAVKAAALDAGSFLLNRMLKGANPTTFTGVYPVEDTDAKIQIMTIVGGLPYPLERLGEIAVRGGQTVDAVADFLGV